MNSSEQIIKQLLAMWANQNNSVSKYFNRYEEEAYLQEVAPGRNRPIYLLGHLVATHDGLLPLFGLGERLYPQLVDIFSVNPDDASKKIPSLTDLKKYWETINSALDGHFSKMQPQQWMERHTAVSEEDFANEPHRNKLNLLISRTNHLSYHFGQLNLLTVKEAVA